MNEKAEAREDVVTVQQQVHRLSERIGAVDMRLEELRGQLAQVLRDSAPRTASDPPPSPVECSCDLAYMLEGLAQSLEGTARTLDDMIERVGL